MRVSTPSKGPCRSGTCSSATRTAPNHRACQGFTLLELLAVVTLAVLLVSVVIVQLTGPHRQAIWRNTIDRWGFVDQQMRARAQRFQTPLELVVDLEGSRLSVRDVGTDQPDQLTFQLGSGIRISQAITLQQRAEFGQLAISCSWQGVTPTYAVALSDRHGQTRWLLLAGITGQLTELDHEHQVNELLSFLAKAGRDAP